MFRHANLSQAQSEDMNCSLNASKEWVLRSKPQLFWRGSLQTTHQCLPLYLNFINSLAVTKNKTNNNKKIKYHNKIPTEHTSWRLHCWWAFQIDLTSWMEVLVQLAAGVKTDSLILSEMHNPKNCQKQLLL